MNFNNLQNNEWQNFIYLSLLLVMLLSGLISRRDFAYARMFKYLTIWSLIGFVFVILYSYRFEFSDFKNRILGEINPSAARVNDGKLIINLAQDGHFYLNVKINNVPIRFMIDTGASDITLSKDDALRIGVNLEQLNFNKIYQTANGRSFGASILLDRFEVAGVRFDNIPASVNSGGMSESLLGMSFLRRCKRYEFYRDQLIIEF